MKNKFKKGDTVICLRYGRNNSDVLKGNKYIISEVHADGMVKLKDHPDWWSPERFKLAEASKETGTPEVTS